jgi:hypothetical protein
MYEHGAQIWHVSLQVVEGLLLVRHNDSCFTIRSYTVYGVGAKSTAAHVAWHVPKAVFQPTIVAGAVAPRVAPQVEPPAE